MLWCIDNSKKCVILTADKEARMLFDEIIPLLDNDLNEPKYNQLARQIETYLKKHSVPPGTRLPSERFLAQRMGISPVTIGRSLNELVRRGVLERKVGSGTYMAEHCRIQSVGILCHEPAQISDYYIGNVLSAIHEYFLDSKIDLLSLVRRPESYVSTLHKYQLDGIIVLAAQKEFVPTIRQLRDSKIPIVTIGVTFPELADLGFGTDHQAISCQATNYLIRKGYRRIGILSGMRYSSSDVSERERGFSKAMYEAGLPVDPDWIIHADTSGEDSQMTELRNLLSRPNRPNALLLACHTDSLLIYNLLREMNLRIPEDISLVAFDDPPYAQHLSPPLTVFAQPILDFTRQAARQLENMILHRPLETFGPSQAVLIERGSCMNYNPDIK